MSKKNTMITNFFRTSKSGVQNTNFSNNKSTFSTLQDSTKLSDVNKKYDNSSSSSSANSKTVSLKRKNNEITLSQSTDIQYNNDNVTNKNQHAQTPYHEHYHMHLNLCMLPVWIAISANLISRRIADTSPHPLPS